MKSVKAKVAVILFFSSLLLYLPILFNPDLLLGRHNDLQEFFWPIFYYTKYHLLNDQGLPLWLNLIFSGTPLLPDPQSFLFYLPNIIFYLLPIPIAFIISLFIHTFWGSLGVYWISKQSFKFSIPISIFTAILFIFSPRLSGYLEAGHFGLAVSFAWIPFVALSVLKITKTKSLIWPVIFGISLTQVYFTHSVTFIITATAASLFFAVILVLTTKKDTWLKNLLLFLLGAIITFGLSAITLLPQLEWTPSTTRSLLLENPDIYPKWTSAWEFLQYIFLPWSGGITSLWGIDTEKWLSLGLLPSAIALFGFWHLKKAQKIFLLITTFIITLISLNNSSPLRSFLQSQDWLALIRVATRAWFIPTFAVIFLTGLGIEHLFKRKRIKKKLIILLAVLAAGELLAISWFRITKPIPTLTKSAPLEIYEFLSNDKDQFRVFCVDRCIPQQKAAEENLELVDGYSTLQQKNYYKHMWQLSGAYWNIYTLSLPPIGTYTFEKAQPDAESLGLYSTKYVISPYELTDTDFKAEKTFNNYTIYRNNLYKSRAYFRAPDAPQAPILIYTPNHIRVDTSSKPSTQLILSEVYSSGWKAYLNGVDPMKIQETPNSLRQIDLKSDTEFVDFYYEPESFKAGIVITGLTLILLVTFSVIKAQKTLA